MAENEHSGVSKREIGLPTKAVQPRLVLGLLGAGSLAGIWVTHGADTVGSRIVTWLLVVSIALLVGGLYWRLALFDRDAFESPAHCRYVRYRWTRIEAVGVWGALLSGVAYLTLVVGNDSSGTGGVSLAVALVCAPVVWAGIRWAGDGSARTNGLRTGLGLVAVVALGGFAWLETGTSPLDWIVRVAHVGAFSLWLGGAIWHNFVVLPTMRTRPDAAKSVKSQARKFRRHLPAVIVFLIASGVYQTDRLVGLDPSVLLGSPVGHLISFKLLVLTVLIGLVVMNYRRTG